MSEYSPWDDVEKNGRDATGRVMADGIVAVLWALSGYKSLHYLLNGWFRHYADNHFYARVIAGYADLDFTTPYEVSMWLKQKIREETNECSFINKTILF